MSSLLVMNGSTGGEPMEVDEGTSPPSFVQTNSIEYSSPDMKAAQVRDMALETYGTPSIFRPGSSDSTVHTRKITTSLRVMHDYIILT